MRAGCPNWIARAAALMNLQDPYRIPGTGPPEPQQPAEHPRVEWRSRTALVIATVSLLVASVAAVFTGLQWNAADKQTDIADRALKLAEKSAREQASDIERSRKAAEGSAAAAKQTADSSDSMAATMREQVNVSIAVSHTDQRAWVMAGGFRTVSVEAGKPLKFGVRISNVGKSVALKCKVIATITTFGKKLNIDIVSKGPSNPLSEPVTPIALFPTVSYDVEPYISDIVTPVDLANILSRKLLIYLWGTVSYEDIFKNPHTTDFCVIYHPDLKAFDACEGHNRAN